MIKGEWEDKIYKTKEFIEELGTVRQSYYNKLRKELIADGFADTEEMDEHLWNFIFNDSSGREFEEYLPSSITKKETK